MIAPIAAGSSTLSEFTAFGKHEVPHGCTKVFCETNSGDCAVYVCMLPKKEILFDWSAEGGRHLGYNIHWIA